MYDMIDETEKKYSLIGIDGNAYAIMGYVVEVMKENGYSQSEIDDYLNNAKSSDYNNLICESHNILEIINESLR